jgi:hypothetical protein
MWEDMEYPEAGAAKRRVLVDALTMVLERSKVAQHVDAQTVKSVLDMAGGELFREGEVRLEYVWKILCQQPGVSAHEVAPPMFVFKAYEQELGVAVRLPQALTAVPRGEQVRLRDELGITKADFATLVGELQQITAAAQTEQSKQAAAALEVRKSEAPAAPSPEYKAAPPTATKRKIDPRVAMGLMLGSLLICAGAVYVTLHQKTMAIDFGPVANVLKLQEGVRQGASISAKLMDSRWDSLPREEKQKLVGEVLDTQVGHGVKVITLRDGAGRVRATATETAAGRVVTVN